METDDGPAAAVNQFKTRSNVSATAIRPGIKPQRRQADNLVTPARICCLQALAYNDRKKFRMCCLSISVRLLNCAVT